MENIPTVPTWIGVMVLLGIILFIIGLLYHFYNIRLKHWRKNLRPGQVVHFYINDERCPGIIENRYRDEVQVYFFSGSHIRHISQIYY